MRGFARIFSRLRASRDAVAVARACVRARSKSTNLLWVR
jgi:hypothetical protein